MPCVRMDATHDSNTYSLTHHRLGRHYKPYLVAPQAAMPADYDPLLHVVLHQPEIPYNTGSVGRTCVAVGAKLWLVRPLGFRVDDYYLRRAGLDYWEHLAWQVVDNWDDLEAALPGHRRAHSARTRSYSLS